MSRVPIDISGMEFGRLVVEEDSGDRAGDGSVKWLCRCVCGNTIKVTSGNLKHGRTRSCGCLAKEMSSERAKRIFTKEKRQCIFFGCANDTSKGAKGYCGMHYARYKRYGDATYVTPEEERRKSARNAMIKRTIASPNTYKKLYGQHEHRAVAENILGRKILNTEHVHHIDFDKHNNDPSNLAVMSRQDHLKLHAEIKSKGFSDVRIERLSEKKH